MATSRNRNKRISSAWATLPFDKHDTWDGIVLKDSFITAIANADLDGASNVTSDLRWVGDEGGGDSAPSVAIVASRDGHQGIIALATGATTAADGDIAGLTLPNAIDFDTNGVYVATLIEIPDVDAQKVSFGFTATRTEAVNSSAAEVVAIVFDPEDAANTNDELFFLQVNVGGVDTEVVFDQVEYVEGDWVLLELAVDATSATARVTTEDNSQTAEIAGVTLATDLLCGYLVEAVGAAEELINIDTFVLRYLNRTQANALGA